MDIFSPARRSDIMASIGSSDTGPEVRLRKALFKQGFRYRTNVKALPGAPDVVLAKHRYAIQVRGCFWHGHAECRRSRLPATRTEFWAEKQRRNAARDEFSDSALRRLGWRVRVVWQCEMTRAADFQRIVGDIIAELKGPRRDAEVAHASEGFQ